MVDAHLTEVALYSRLDFVEVKHLVHVLLDDAGGVLHFGGLAEEDRHYLLVEHDFYRD